MSSSGDIWDRTDQIVSPHYKSSNIWFGESSNEKTSFWWYHVGGCPRIQRKIIGWDRSVKTLWNRQYTTIVFRLSVISGSDCVHSLISVLELLICSEEMIMQQIENETLTNWPLTPICYNCSSEHWWKHSATASSTCCSFSWWQSSAWPEIFPVSEQWMGRLSKNVLFGSQLLQICDVQWDYRCTQVFMT